jgi:hypothetical protein
LKGNENEKMKLHLMYISVIFGIILLALLALVFVESTTAISSLSYASTLLSIVLAVIAILITLWDVAGQKNTIYEIKSETEKLKGTVDDFKDAYSNADDIIDRIRNLQNYLVEMINDNNNMSQAILEGIEEIKQSQDGDEKVKKLDELEKTIKGSLQFQNINYQGHDDLDQKFGFNYQEVRKKLLSFIYINFKEVKFTLNEVNTKYFHENTVMVPPLLLNNVLRELQKDGLLQKVKENGVTFYKFY